MSLSNRHSAAILGFALLLSYAYFYQAGGWNQNSRFALVRAILDRHTLQIDAYHEHTGDRALWEGHYYSDKAPGAALLALAPAGLARGIARTLRVNPGSLAGVIWASYVATVLTSGLFTVVAALLVMQLALKWGFSRGAALFAATSYGIASPAWCYATLFMGHAITAGALMLGYAAAVDPAACLVGPKGPRRHPGSDVERPFDVVRPLQGRAWLVGLWTGFAVITEFPAAVPAFFIVVLALLNVRDRRLRDLSAAATRIVAGGMISGVVLLSYNAVAFGSPFHLGYASEEGFEQLHVGFFGIAYPEWWRVREILVGSYRGLLPLAPLFALTPIGLATLARAPSRRWPAVVAGSGAAFYLLLNASYYYWEGGWAYGPRHLVPALPFLALALAPLWDSWGRVGRALLSVGWLWGAALTLIAVSTTPQPPDTFRAPVRELLWPAFEEGDLSLNNQSFVTFRAQRDLLRNNPAAHAAWNLGQLAGLHGLVSLIPLGVVWLVVAAILLL